MERKSRSMFPRGITPDLTPPDREEEEEEVDDSISRCGEQEARRRARDGSGREFPTTMEGAGPSNDPRDAVADDERSLRSHNSDRHELRGGDNWEETPPHLTRSHHLPRDADDDESCENILLHLTASDDEEEKESDEELPNEQQLVSSSRGDDGHPPRRRRSSINLTPDDDGPPLRILALHGARSNPHVTALQLANLCITQRHLEEGGGANNAATHDDDNESMSQLSISRHRHSILDAVWKTEEVDVDVVHLRGHVEVEGGDGELLAMGIDGPFFSWFNDHGENDGNNEELVILGLGSSLVESVRRVLKFVDSHGPFDGVYGFSSGAIVAKLVAGIGSDPGLAAAVAARDAEENAKNKRSRFHDGLAVPGWPFHPSRHASSSHAPPPDSEDVFEDNPAADLEAPPLKTRPSSSAPPFKFVILACSAAPASIEDLRSAAGVPPTKSAPPSVDDEDDGSIPTFHMIGVNDRHHRHQSEDIAASFPAENREIWYLPGPQGHGITREVRHDADLVGAIQKFLKCKGRGQQQARTARDGAAPEYRPVSSVSSVASLMPSRQVVLVDVDLDGDIGARRRTDEVTTALTRSAAATNKDDDSILLRGQTIVAMLLRQPPSAPLLRVARSSNPAAATTYGDVLDFISAGGGGDLRALGVTPGEVVAYAVLPSVGGAAVHGSAGSGPASAAAALAFLAIGSQTAAAPLPPETGEEDALLALEQFDARHLILFENGAGGNSTGGGGSSIDANDAAPGSGLRAAFEVYAARGNGARLHLARILGDDKPGMFEFVTTTTTTPDSDAVCKNSSTATATSTTCTIPPGVLLGLTNPASGTCLLLRTSGTTSTPKVVPLLQGQLVANGRIIAASMDLAPDDVCYGVMPLFHIGGLSASVLCTLASGGTVCCEGEGYDPGRMVEALATSRPRPTWYSAVPTIHNATVAYLRDSGVGDTERGRQYGIGPDGTWPRGPKGHALRMIRSGAAALLPPDAEALAAAFGGTVPIYSTYSMSEQMPISQPPAGGARSMMRTKPGSVGVPVAASLAIVNAGNLRPQPPGVEGEIAICGPTLMGEYRDNPEANRTSFFHLHLPGGGAPPLPSLNRKFFLTGDVGVLDGDGHLYLRGRSKELIKRGGEQISPFDIEEALLGHPLVRTAVCFAVPSPLFGEEVGCAVVLSPSAAAMDVREVAAELRFFLGGATNLAPEKFPTKWKVLRGEEDLPRTKTKKVIRVGLSAALGLDPTEEDLDALRGGGELIRAKMDWRVLNGLRFTLACYVMFMHIGSNESFGAVANLRGFPWHVHLFFTLAAYSMTAPMAPPIEKKAAFVKARIRSMLPMYYVALAFGVANLLVSCRPGTFDVEFHWDAQPDDGRRPLFCEGTPAFPRSWWGSFVSTLVVYAFGLQVTPFWPFTWWIGFYLWFSAMYHQCLVFFPVMYNSLMKLRKNSAALLKVTAGLMALNVAILLAAWFSMKTMTGYSHNDPVTGEKNNYTDRTQGDANNILALSFYLFGPFWIVYFAIGSCTAFLYDAYCPVQTDRKRMWGWIADSVTLLIICISVALIFEGTFAVDNALDENQWRPDEADAYADAAQIRRIWDAISARLFAPVTTLWVFALSTGQGLTARIFRSRILVDHLAPTSYHCFLFHQMIAQWYFAITRGGDWWSWWGYRKTMYWFSPAPCPVEWYEYPILVLITVCWSKLMTKIEHLVTSKLAQTTWCVWAREQDDSDPTADVVCRAIENITGMEPKVHLTFEECGLTSIGVPALVHILNKAFAKQPDTRRLKITASSLIAAKTVQDLVHAVDEAKKVLNADGV